MSEFDANFHAPAAIPFPSAQAAQALGLGQALPLRQQRPDEQIAISPQPDVKPVEAPPMVLAVSNGNPSHRSEDVESAVCLVLLDPSDRVRSLGRTLAQLTRELASEIKINAGDLDAMQRDAQRSMRLLSIMDQLNRTTLAVQELVGD